MLRIIALIALTQDAAAEEALKKIEAAALEAQSLQVRIKGSMTGPEKPTEFTCTLAVKGNKVCLETTFPDAPQDPTFLVSDGAVTRMRVRGGLHAQLHTPEHLGADLRLLLTRSGMQGVSALAMDLFTIGKELGEPSAFGKAGLADLAKLVAVKDLRAGEVKDGRVLTYRALVGVKKTEVENKLWFEAASSKPLRRTAYWKDEDGKSVSLSETYEEYSLGAEIPDGKFKLPEEKK